jgi:hypothetical protein
MYTRDLLENPMSIPVITPLGTTAAAAAAAATAHTEVAGRVYLGGALTQHKKFPEKQGRVSGWAMVRIGSGCTPACGCKALVCQWVGHWTYGVCVSRPVMCCHPSQVLELHLAEHGGMSVCGLN